MLSREAIDTDLETMLDTLVPAFDSDPVWGGWAFPDPSRASMQRRGLFRLWLQGALRYGSIRVTPNCEAVAVWYPAEGTASSADEQRELVEMAHSSLGDHAEIFLRGSGILEASHPQQPAHHYLCLLGTHVSYRGRGLGMSLLRENLAMLDAVGIPAYLESTNPKNVSRYERLGFKRTGAIDLPAGGPRVDLMWRSPHQAAPLGS
jgi:GNAT superfamily N-acetyltransferase